jgi:hypothetical protein
VEVDESAALVFGDLGVGQSGMVAKGPDGDAERGGQGAPQGDGGTVRHPVVGQDQWSGRSSIVRQDAHR